LEISLLRRPICVHQSSSEGKQPREKLRSLAEYEKRSKGESEDQDRNQADLDQRLETECQAWRSTHELRSPRSLTSWTDRLMAACNMLEGGRRTRRERSRCICVWIHGEVLAVTKLKLLT